MNSNNTNTRAVPLSILKSSTMLLQRKVKGSTEADLEQHQIAKQKQH
jgi:hypothetical protein